jgi:phytoene dehydrogenase-like protein
MWKIRHYLPLFRRWGGSIEKLAAKFQSAALRVFLESINPIPGMPAMSLLMMLTVLDRREAGWPEGGSLRLALSIARRYKELGGAIRYGARVKEIIVKDDRAIGVRLADGSEHFTDEVISAADGHATIFRLLNGRYLGRALERAYRTLPLYTPLVQVSFGVNRNMADAGLPRLTTFRLREPRMIGEKPVSLLLLNNYGFDPSMAPAGKATLSVLYLSPWEHWEPLCSDRRAYLARKRRVLEDVTRWLEEQFPGITRDIEVTDVATPLTTVRYTGNYKASYEGWRPAAETMRVKLDRRLPGLAGFSMVGQWTSPAAGLPTVAGDGRVAIREMCAQDGKDFVTTLPPEREFPRKIHAEAAEPETAA